MKLTDLPEEKIFNTLTEESYVANTDGIKISVTPTFVSGSSGIYVWSYHVTITNNGNKAITLLSRYWKIIDGTGIIQEVRGEGVIGEQPTIAPNTSFDYSSGVHLAYPSGIMVGYYKMQTADNELHEIRIPAFSLDVPDPKKVIN